MFAKEKPMPVVLPVLPLDGNIFQDKVPAGISLANGYGKLTGLPQVKDLGTIETPIVLTNTLSVPTAADASDLLK
jgi:D-aminopeptidase